jgi:tetratricopeptide (TPR) repeat protein
VARYVALGAHRLPPAPDASREERLERSREMLAHALCQETTVAVVGSGCSVPLGYPSWKGFAAELIDRTLAVLAGRQPIEGDGSQREQLLRIQRRLVSTPRPDSEDLMFSIGVCKRLLGGDSPEDNPYLSHLQARFQPAGLPANIEPNPHRALLKLPIHRFVTTNYDVEIERALADERAIDWAQFGIGIRPDHAASDAGRLSFTQRPRNCDQLALFALSRVGEARNMVFHCHGRFDDPASIVATELDYQKWYLAEEEEAASAFLQTFDLLFNSNPILLVGFGLGDEDLLRPLRRIAATTPERRPFRPLFALLPETADGEDRVTHERLFERYGLNVIPFLAPTTPDPRAWGRVLCAELGRLEEERCRWRDQWLEKPLLRRVTVNARPPQLYRHYGVDPTDHETLGRQRVNDQLEKLERGALAGARVIGLVGPGGTGKSWHAMRLLEVMQHKASEFQGFFFWSSYYADDWITGLDRLLGYIDPKGNRPASRFKRLRERLAASRYLIVLDGLERLLHPTDDPETGRSNDSVTKRLLEIFADTDSRSTLILTSRLWPCELDPNAPRIEKHTLERMRTDDVLDVEPFSRFERSQVSALCSLLEGHAYALSLAARFIQGQGAERDELFLTLIRTLSGVSPNHRLATMIKLAVEGLDRETDHLALALLKRLAVFMSPVTEETVHLCFALAAERKARNAEAVPIHQHEVVKKLLGGSLLFQVATAPTEREPSAFTVHPTVRSYIFQQPHQIEHDVLPNFTLAGFTSGRAAVHPGSPDMARLVRELFDRLHEETLRELRQGRNEVARRIYRSLFGIMRSRMETNTVPLWTNYGEYVRFGLRLADLAKRLSPSQWNFREPHELAAIEHPEAPLYADELAFIYNDIGLTYCAEGYMQDTLALWEQGFEINRLIEGNAEVPLYTLQSQLHLGHTFLELGNLSVAAQYLQEAARTNHSVQDQDYSGRIVGYQALINYYRGHLVEADAQFGKALQKLKEGGGNPRAQSFFLSHRAKLATVLGRYDRAKEYVRTSLALAATGQAEDLIAYARTAKGRLFREQKSFVAANAEYHAALVEARRLGIRRLEAEILTGLSRLALNLGDTALARGRAMAALSIANELGLGLRQTQSLLVLGLATVEAGQPQLGAAYLRLAKRLGDEQEYWLRSREAEQSLQGLGGDRATGDI